MNQPAAKQVDFPRLISVVKPILDKNKATQLEALYSLFRGNNINKEEFVKHMRRIVGDRLLKMTVHKLQQGQMLMESTSNQFCKPAQLTPKLNSLPMKYNTHGVHNSSNVNAVKQHQQQHIRFPQSSFANNGGNYSHPYMNMPYMKMMRGPVQNVFNDAMRHDVRIQSLTSSLADAKQKLMDLKHEKQHKSRLSVPQSQNVSAGNSSLASGMYAKTPPIKESLGQKKPLEEHVSSLCKKQKVCGAFMDQSTKQLNDVTAVSGVNLRLFDEDDDYDLDYDDDGFVKLLLLDPKQEQSMHIDQNLMSSMAYAKQDPVSIAAAELEHKNVPASSSSGSNVETSPQKATVVQKKSLEAHVSSPSNKPKETVAFLDQTINQLDDDDHDEDDDGDVELLDPKQEQCELVENASPMSNSMENLSSQSGMVCIKGYKVNQNNATILKDIFKKHGDIAGKCVFKTSSARAYFLEVICEVVRRVQTNDMTEIGEDIECQVTDAESANINVTWLRAHLEAVNKRKETSKYSLLLEKKENVISARKAAQMDMRERCAELMAAQQRFKNAEKSVKVFHIVEKNLDDNIFESKAKLDSWVNYPVV